MPKYRNSFRAAAFSEETVLDEKGRVIGTVRIKPVSILWKPKGTAKFYSVSLDDFVKWITDSKTKARKTAS